MSFIPPDTAAIRRALGDITKLPSKMQLAVTNKLEESFQPIPRPKRGDWLADHEERGQTMLTFQRNAFKAVPHASFKTIYIQPYGSFDSPRAAPLNVIIEFTSAFFAGCNVQLLSTVNFNSNMKHRINEWTSQIQYLTNSFYDDLAHNRRKRNPRQELLCVAVTMADLYPDDAWNFVYGEANSTDGLGVFSFARLDPKFPVPPDMLVNIPLTEEDRTIILRRSIKILLHEIGHLFGLKHCIYYVCLMNGANHEKEMDVQPLYLCPICLHKLYSTLQFDVQELYEKFANLCEKYGLEEERNWYRKRLDCIQ